MSDLMLRTSIVEQLSFDREEEVHWAHSFTARICVETVAYLILDAIYDTVVDKIIQIVDDFFYRS